jgi:hypothetical protein
MPTLASWRRSRNINGEASAALSLNMPFTTMSHRARQVPPLCIGGRQRAVNRRRLAHSDRGGPLADTVTMPVLVHDVTKRADQDRCDPLHRYAPDLKRHANGAVSDSVANLLGRSQPCIVRCATGPTTADNDPGSRRRSQNLVGLIIRAVAAIPDARTAHLRCTVPDGTHLKASSPECPSFECRDPYPPWRQWHAPAHLAILTQSWTCHSRWNVPVRGAPGIGAESLAWRFQSWNGS